ncbi:MAG: hypothetical protein ACI97A_002042 [Planctomycetota bacterium]|jgi:hypothetical protein
MSEVKMSKTMSSLSSIKDNVREIVTTAAPILRTVMAESEKKSIEVK